VSTDRPALDALNELAILVNAAAQNVRARQDEPRNSGKALAQLHDLAEARQRRTTRPRLGD
jgi:hypothetical protein